MPLDGPGHAEPAPLTSVLGFAFCFGVVGGVVGRPGGTQGGANQNARSLGGRPEMCSFGRVPEGGILSGVG